MFRSIILAIALFASVTAHADDEWRPVQGTKWTPIPPSGGGAACTLTAPDGVALQGNWRSLVYGDTLRFDLRGSGSLRVETRAVVDDGTAEASYRMGVRTSPSVVRKLSRNSGGAIAVQTDCGPSLITVLDADRWETEIVAGSERVDVFLREDRGQPVMVRLLARGEIERPGLAGGPPPEWNLEAGILGVGFTTNAYLAPSDSNSAETALFLPVDITAGVRIEPRRNLRLDFEYGFDAVLFSDTILNEYRHRLQAQQRWENLDLGRMGTGQFELEERLRTKDRTYFGRGYDEEAETAAGNPPADQAPLADRFDWREYSVMADLGIEATDEFDYGFAAGYVRKDYVEDYEDDPNTYALDWGGAVAQAQAEWKNDRDFYVELTAEVSDRRYDEKYARDVDGNTIVTETSHLSYWPIDVEVGRRPHIGWRWNAGVAATRILDHYEGYWDRTAWDFHADATLAMKEGHRFRLGVARSVTNYDRARVGNTPAGPIREKDTWSIGGKADYALGEHWRAVAEIDLVDRNNNSRTFDYSVVEGFGGLSWVF